MAPRNSDGGSSDPYCIIYYGDKKEKTKPVLKTLNPIWNEGFVFVVDARVQSLKFEVPCEQLWVLMDCGQIYDVGTLRDEYMYVLPPICKLMEQGRDCRRSAPSAGGSPRRE